MPAIGLAAKNLKMARKMLEYCRFSYKLYAQTCVYPMDPFYEAHGEGTLQGARDRLMAKIHVDKGTQGDEKKFDPIEYDFTNTPNPHQGVIYRGGAKSEPYTLLHPRSIDKAIVSSRGFDLDGNAVGPAVATVSHTGALRNCPFMGRTGMTKNHPDSGWKSWLGSVVFDPATRVCVIVFRGSRSGVGSRALLQAQFKSIGSPDWVTDMNHLKEVKVPELKGAAMACGFWYAFASCRQSLIAAYHEAVGNAKPEAIYITGHSLGGGLAQCCYIDLMMGGELTRELVASKMMSNTAEIICYPISAPPVVLGKVSHRKLALSVDATQILHYFCDKDCVHDSPLVTGSVVKVGNWVMGSSTHPLTSPYHLGVEIPLANDNSFPDAHEPREVWRSLHASLDQEFWPTFTFDFLKSHGSFVTGLPSSLNADLKAAFQVSISAAQANNRANQWLSVAKGVDTREEVVNVVRQSGAKAIDLIRELANPVSPQLLQARREQGFGSIESLPEKRKRLAKLRNDLLEVYSNAGDHKATASAMWVVLQYITAAQVWLEVK